MSTNPITFDSVMPTNITGGCSQSNMLAASEAILVQPEAAARAAAAASNKQRAEQEAAITSAVSTALHWLNGSEAGEHPPILVVCAVSSCAHK